MDIAQMAISMNQAQLQQEVGVSVMKMVMDSSKAQTEDLVKVLETATVAMEQAVSPHLGGNIDLKL